MIIKLRRFETFKIRASYEWNQTFKQLKMLYILDIDNKNYIYIYMCAFNLRSM